MHPIRVRSYLRPLIFLLVLVLAQCGDGQSVEVVPTEAPLEPSEVIYISSLDFGAPQTAEKELVNQFEALYPQLDVIRREDSSGELEEYLTSDTPPDVILIEDPAVVQPFIAEGLVMDLSDLWAREGWNETYLQRARTLSTVDDKQYMVPSSYGWMAIYYNKKIFEAHGLTPPESWDQFVVICEVLKSKGMSPIALGNRDRWPAAMWFSYLSMRINGPDFQHKLIAGQEHFDDPRVRQVFERWKAMLDAGYFGEKPWNDTWPEAVTLLVKGEAAMTLATPFDVLDLVPKALQEDFGFFRFPVVNSTTPIGEYAPINNYYIVPAKAPHPEAAKAFLSYLGSVDGQSFMVRQLGLFGHIPVHSGVDPADLPPEVRQGREMIQSAKSLDQLMWAETDPTLLAEGQRLFNMFVTKPSDVNTILESLEAERARAFPQ